MPSFSDLFSRGQSERNREQGRLSGTRQADRGFSELADLAIDFDRPAMLLGDDVPGGRQAEPSAFAGRFGRHKGLEQFVPDLGGDAGAIVAYPHFDRVAEIARRYR